MKKHLVSLIFIFGLTLWFTFSLFKPGWFASHDGIYHIRRVGEMTEMLKMGYFPVRWGLNLDNYYGTPIFNYVYPGPYYLASFITILSPLGTPTILKLLAIGSFASGGLAWYFFFQKQSRLYGVVAATLYLTTPYQLLNLFVRFSLGEIVVLGILPWVLVMYQHQSRHNRLFWYAPLPLFLALISHNFLGLLGMVVLLLYAYFRFPHFSLLLKTTLISLALSSFFLLPMFLERGLIISGAKTDFSFHYFDHFVYFSQLLYSRWDYWYSMPGIANDGMTFQLGFAQIATVVLSIFLIIVNRRRSNFTLPLLYFVVIFLMLPSSRFIWDALPLLQSVQFPWRLLGIAALLTPLFISHLKPNLVLAIGLLILGLVNTRNYRLPMKFWNNSEFATEYALIKDKTATSLRQELVPHWAGDERWQNSLASGSALSLDPRSTQGNIIFAASGSGTESATIQKNFFPAWTAKVDGQKLTLSPTQDGSIAVALLPGTHTYQIQLGSTIIETLGNLLSLSTIGILFILKFRHVN